MSQLINAIELMSTSDIDRFWTHVDRRGDNDCWEWTRVRARSGVGRFFIGPRGAQIGFQAHRVAAQLSGINTNGTLLQICNNRSCCNPQHMETRTRAISQALAKEREMCISHKKNPVVEGYTRCAECLNKKATQREILAQNGYCPSHKNERLVEGRKTCHRCASSVAQRRKEALARGECPGHIGTPLAPNKKACEKCIQSQAEHHLRKKQTVFKHYGFRCACEKCPLPEPGLAFLQIDHINNDGAKHRRDLGKSDFYAWLIRNKFPEGFQTLCINCNVAKSYNKGICPHLVEVK